MMVIYDLLVDGLYLQVKVDILGESLDHELCGPGAHYSTNGPISLSLQWGLGVGR